VRSGAATAPDRDEFGRRWSRAHSGADPGARLVGGYLTAAHRAARPLAAAGVAPDALTLAGALAALAALAPAAAGGRWPLLAAVAVAASAVLDGLDGAVALLTDRSSRWGAVLDGLADRLAEAAFCAVLWLVGAPGWLAGAAAATAWLHEYARARAGAAGMAGVGRVTVSERPTRVAVVVLFTAGAGVVPAHAGAWAGAGALAAAVLGLAGLAQLLLALRRVLAEPETPT
jgi:phosphatidylglycerophosphate synthase